MATFYDSDLERFFPQISNHGYRVTSPSSISYNCIAWALEKNNRWWWPDPLQIYYWPNEIPRESTVQAFIKLFELSGYTKCNDGSLEVGYQKVALYIDEDGTPTHAARQLKSGKWTSKLGSNKDIEHNDLQGLIGDKYGLVGAYFKCKL